jgi:glycerol uptake facilitator-like aquaporin
MTIKKNAERMLHPQESPDFLDDTLEWRRLFSEFWGTFLLVLVAAGAGVDVARSGGAVSIGALGATQPGQGVSHFTALAVGGYIGI